MICLRSSIKKIWTRPMARRNSSGQALLEVALVLPVLIVAISVGVQVIIYSHNQIALEVLASKVVRRLSAEAPVAPRIIYPNPLWGRATPPLVSSPNREAPQPWRHFVGLSRTVTTAGRYVSVELSSRLFPGISTGRLLLTQNATGETLLEPSRPPEDD
jgi:hypothetical protein